MFKAAPLHMALLNRKKVSPCTSGEPGLRLVTITVPVPALVNKPLTTIWSLVGERDLSTSILRLPNRVRLLPKLSVPTELPGDMTPPDSTVTGPRIVPMPPRDALVATVTAPTLSWPLTRRVPPLTVG